MATSRRRPGPRPRHEDRQRGWRLFAQQRHAVFYCENCGGSHQLLQHRTCRQAARGGPARP